MGDSKRLELRRECHEDVAALRAGGELPERTFRLLEKLVLRLDRLETGDFPTEETPTNPEIDPAKKGSGTWSNKNVLAALKEGKDAP